MVLQSQEQIDEAKAAGFTEDQINEVLNRTKDDPRIAKAKAAGFSDAEIELARRQLAIRDKDFTQAILAEPAEQFGARTSSEGFAMRAPGFELGRDTIIGLAEELGVDPTTQEGINAIYNEEGRRFERQTIEGIGERARIDAIEDGASEEEANLAAEEAVERYTSIFRDDVQSFVTDIEELNNVDRPFEWLASNFGGRAEAEYQAIQNRNIQTIQEMAAERGLTVQYDPAQGDWFAQDANGEWQLVTPGFLDALGASKYEIAGATIGGISTAKLGKAVSQKFPGPKWVGKLLGLGIVGTGTTAGAIAGDQIDYMMAAMDAQADLDAKVALEKAVGTAEFSVIGEVLGYGVFKAGRYAFRKMQNAYRFFKDGNTEGAYEALKQAVGNISDDEARAIVSRWEKLNQMKAPGKSAEEQALAIVPTTEPGGESIIGATVKRDPSTSLAVSNEVNTRAKSLLEATKRVADPEAGAKILTNLDEYKNTVRSFYDVVNEAGLSAVRPSYKFNFPKLGIRPLLEQKIATIADPAKIEQLTRVLTKIDETTKGRSFPDLLDLYRTLNDFKFNRRLVKGNDKKAVNETLATVRNEIEKITSTTKKGRAWYSDWKQANKDYAQMKQLERNALFKALTKPGVSEKDIAKQLVKYSPAIDDTYLEVMAKLSPKTQRLTENAIMDELVNKFTVGRIGEFRATDFPSLADELTTYTFKTPEAKRLKEVVERMSEVYKNDIKLAASSGKIQLPNFQSYLTTDPVIRAKYEIASTVFNKVKSLAPGQQAKTLAMVDKVAKLLEQPLNARTTKQVIEAVKDDQELVAAINRFQADVAKENATQGTQLFKDKSGRLFDTQSAGRTVVDDFVYPQRVMLQEDLLEELGEAEFKKALLTPKVKKDLLDRGINAIKSPDGQIILLDRK